MLAAGHDRTVPHRRWMATIAAIVGIAAAISVAACSGRTGQTADQGDDLERRNVELIRAAFALGVGGEDSFYSILADDVHWTVATAADSPEYFTRRDFIEKGAKPITARLTSAIRADVTSLIADRDTVVALWVGSATALDGSPYVNRYNWVMTIRDGRVSRVIAYLDQVALNDLIARIDIPE